MDIQTLVRMANQIGDFFQPMPDRGQALEDIAQHVRKFWEPRMRRQMLEHLDKQQGEGLSDIVKSALLAHRSLLE
ncbi:formate dehydrogenase subunit delta [Achromobacter sp. F4_2707]|uniref:formate dehydrogenase subunit delta n=1 Tax=Achromobacter sp. F4_2707 TaxID=3114286 RepID=UPI0039C73B1A